MHPSTTPCTEPRVYAAIDPEIYRSLAEIMEDGMIDLVADFIATTRDLLTALAAAESNRDLPTMKLHAHSIKSSAAVVGAMLLSELARGIEATAATDGLDARAPSGAARVPSSAAWVPSSAAIHDEFARVSHELGRLAGTAQ
jgi:HPt (histidine-containing phosphotransfer) domain-containing protein